MATTVPTRDDSETVARALAGLGYPGFAYLGLGESENQIGRASCRERVYVLV